MVNTEALRVIVEKQPEPINEEIVSVGFKLLAHSTTNDTTTCTKILSEFKLEQESEIFDLIRVIIASPIFKGKDFSYLKI